MKNDQQHTLTISHITSIKTQLHFNLNKLTEQPSTCNTQIKIFRVAANIQ